MNQHFSTRTLKWAHYLRCKAVGEVHDAHKHYVYGMRCGYPECCVEFYCELHDMGLIYIGEWADGAYGEQGDVGYVQCLKCRGERA